MSYSEGLHILILHHDGREEERDLGPGRWTIGRSRENWLCPVDTTLSRQHAVLEVGEDRVEIDALPTANPTRINGKPVTGRYRLAVDDQVLVGRTLIQLRAGRRRDHRRHQPTVELGGEPASPGSSLIAVSPVMRELLDQCARLAASDLPVLITGESGTGKEVLARHLHQLSPRRDGPFEVVNCPALPSSLVESELFGVEAGVATGVDRRQGRLEQADGGTLLLDEIADLALEAQAKLLRFLQDRTIERVGGRKPIPLDVRVIAATNQDTDEAIAGGDLRADLYFRIAALHIHLPPLRERREDIPPLADWFLSRQGHGDLAVSDEALALLHAYPFAGNVRELEAIMARAALLACEGVIRGNDLGLRSTTQEAQQPGLSAHALLDAVHRREADFWEAVYQPFQTRELPRSLLRDLVAAGLERSGGTVKSLAEYLHTGDRYRKLLDFLRNNRLMPD